MEEDSGPRATAACSFCGEEQTSSRQLFSNTDGSAVICEQCLIRLMDILQRQRLQQRHVR